MPTTQNKLKNTQWTKGYTAILDISKYYYGNKIKEDEKGDECTYGR
jgi:hypothetical protein